MPVTRGEFLLLRVAVGAQVPDKQFLLLSIYTAAHQHDWTALQVGPPGARVLRGLGTHSSTTTCTTACSMAPSTRALTPLP